MTGVRNLHNPICNATRLYNSAYAIAQHCDRPDTGSVIVVIVGHNNPFSRYFVYFVFVQYYTVTLQLMLLIHLYYV
jgi:hypothetical protein